MLSQYNDSETSQILASLLNYCHQKGGAAATLNYPTNDTCSVSQGLTYLWSPTNPPTDATAKNLEASYQQAKSSNNTIIQNLQNICVSMGGQTYQAPNSSASTANASMSSGGILDFIFGSNNTTAAPSVGICAKGLVISNMAPDNIWSPAKPPTQAQVIGLENQLFQSQNYLAQALNNVANQCAALSPANSQITYDDTGCSYHGSKIIWSPSQPDPTAAQLYSQLNSQGSNETLSNVNVILIVVSFLGILFIVFSAIGAF